MENNTEKQEFEFSIVSFLKIFKGKLKMLIALGVIAALLGGVLGALTSMKKEYGNTLTFYFPTPEKGGYSTAITLLRSDRFTENILIGTRPVEYTDADGNVTEISIPDLSFSEEDEKKIIEYSYAKQSAMKKMGELKKDLKKLPSEINLLKSTFEEKQSAYGLLREEYNRLWGVYETELAKEAKEAITALQPTYDKAMAEYDEAQKAYTSATTLQADKKNELYLAENTIAEADEKSEKVLAPYLEAWRNQPKNKADIRTYSDNVRFSFTLEGLKSETPEPVKDGAKYSFIYVDISIPKNQELANKIINNILEQIDSYLVPNMTAENENDLIECKHLSYGSAKEVNESGLFSSIIKYGIIVFAIVEILACVFILLSFAKKTFFRDEPATESAVENKNEDSENEET